MLDESYSLQCYVESYLWLTIRSDISLSNFNLFDCYLIYSNIVKITAYTFNSLIFLEFLLRSRYIGDGVLFLIDFFCLFIYLFIYLFIQFFLCFFVSKLTRKRMDRFAWNFQGRCGVTMGRTDYIFGQFWETARSRDTVMRNTGRGLLCFRTTACYFIFIFTFVLFKPTLTSTSTILQEHSTVLKKNQNLLKFNITSCGAKAHKPRPRVAHRGIARFLGIDQKCNQVIPWSLHTFPESFMQIGSAVYS